MLYSNNVSVPGNEYTLKLVGFNEARRNILASLCNLSKTRNRRYRIDTSKEFFNADIVLVDMDDSTAVEKWHKVNGKAAGKPCIYIGNPDVNAAGYTLRRTQLSGQLLRLLDTITTNDLNGRSQTIGETAKVNQTSPTANIEFTAAAGRVGTVLIVDDSLLVRKNMELCMQALNVELDCAVDAETGIRMAQNKQYHIIFMDIMLPEMNGYQACKLIKSRQSTRETPVIMMTSKTSPFNKVKGVMVGCDQYLTKPVDARALRNVIAKYIPLNAHTRV